MAKIIAEHGVALKVRKFLSVMELGYTILIEGEGSVKIQQVVIFDKI